MHADTDGNTCLWQIRDRHGWRHTVLVTASADILIAWYTASIHEHAPALLGRREPPIRRRRR